MPSADEMTVLMVDDQEPDAYAMRKAFASVSSNVAFDWLASGEDLLGYLLSLGSECAPPHLILLDLNLEQTSGFEILRQLKSNPDTAAIPVVVLTRSQNDDDMVEAYRLGANSYITKPTNSDTLALVANIIDSYWFQVASLPGRKTVRF